MSDIVIMPKADYEATCDAIRARTGKTDLIKSGDLKTEIEAITGGTSADVCYVTFLSDDGTVEYGKKAVAVGDDCADPIERGVFDTPTKESTVQYDYTFAGWTLDTGGEKDSTALQAVTEDRTVYAAYTSTIRYYTITYYDGETVLKTESLAYGSAPSYKPSKDGYNFEGWEPELTTVVGDTNYYSQWSEALTFAGASWADIARISEAGEAENYFKVGDTKEIIVEDTTLTLIIIGFNHDTLADGTGKAGITIVSENTLSDTYAVSSWTTLAANMRNGIKTKLPSDLQAVIKPVMKECDYSTVKEVTSPFELEFDVFPLSFEECGIAAHGARRKTDSDWETGFTTLGSTYSYFADNYNASRFGPYGTFLRQSKGYWYRQLARFGSTAEGLYSAVSMYSAQGIYTYASNTTRDTLKPVMMAFCI